MELSFYSQLVILMNSDATALIAVTLFIILGVMDTKTALGI